jgi:replicative DNA helicase
MPAVHDIERALLAVVVQTGQGQLLEGLHAGCFDAEHNRAIYSALRELHEGERPLDEPSLLAQLDRAATLTKAGGRASVTALYYHDTALPASAPSYLRELHEHAARRAVGASLASLSRLVEDPDAGLAAITEKVENELLRLRAGVPGENYETATSMMAGAFNLIDLAQKRGDGLVGIDTGLPEINDLLGGWEKGTLTVILGTPGVGKTALWLQSAVHVAARHTIGMVQLEMTAAKMGMRVLAAEARVSFRKLRRGQGLSDRDLQRLSDMAGRIAGRNLLLAPNGVDAWPDVKAFYRRCVIDHGAAALFLDNLKIVSVPGAKTDLERFNTITRELKLLARALDVPIIAIHHMSRQVAGSKPTLQSGYGSSSVEQDADNVLALWRPDEQLEDEVELLPLKTRDDWAKAKPLLWVGDQQRYTSMLPAEKPAGMFDA